jgi:hypothetical protein
MSAVPHISHNYLKSLKQKSKRNNFFVYISTVRKVKLFSKKFPLEIIFNMACKCAKKKR